jgi:Leucine-rich repeat (LRR) protein
MDLPLDFVQNCSVLRELHMAFNDLDRVPINVRSIVHLQVLDLRGNRIRNLEKARLEDAKELVTLYLQSNRLDSIPDSFKFEFLRILNLSSNRFTRMPMVLFEIAELEELDMSFNDLSEIPDEIGQLVKLRRLWLFGNQLGPNLPKTMSKLNRLQTLDIRRNNILSLDAVNDLRALKELLVDYNSDLVLNNSFKSLKVASFLKCKITSINIQGTGSTLTSLDMSSNKLSNLDSALFEHMQSLETLKLDNNSISSMPGEIGTLKRLKYLSISNNLLSSLPEEVGQMEALLELDVHGNNLSELPVAIWKCSLATLNASSNVLESFPDPPKLLAPPSANPGPVSTLSSSATIPELGTSTTAAPAVAATTANGGPSSSGPLRPNPLPAPTIPLQSTPSGRAPHAPPLANSLTTLRLGDNRLPDEVMYPLSQLLKLEILNLSHNYIAEIPRGKIPNPADILELYLSGNQLTSLPAEDMERLQSLQVLHVNGNKLTTLPAELGRINTLEVLDVGCNMLKYNISNWPYDWNW